MKIDIKRIFIIISINNISLIFATTYDLPNCPDPTENTKIKSPQKVNVIFIIGFEASAPDKDKIAYFVNQFACWFPTNPQISSAVFDSSGNSNSHFDNTEVKEMHKKMRKLNNAEKAADCAKFKKALATINFNGQPDFDKVKIITHAEIISGSSCDHFQAFKDSQMDSSRYEMFQIVFSADSNPNKLSYPGIGSINTTANATDELKKITSDFMDRVFGVYVPPTPPTPPPTKPSDEGGFPRWAIVAIIAGILIVALLIALVIICRKKIKKVFKKKGPPPIEIIKPPCRAVRWINPVTGSAHSNTPPRGME